MEFAKDAANHEISKRCTQTIQTQLDSANKAPLRNIKQCKEIKGCIRKTVKEKYSTIILKGMKGREE